MHDSYTYSDFYNQCNGQNADDVLENVIDDAQRVIVHCNGSYIKKSKNWTFDILETPAEAQAEAQA